MTRPSPQPGQSSRVLVADDDRDYRRLLCELLASRGYEPVEAPDGTAALEAVDDVDPDVALVDVRMPGLDGISFTRAIREDARHAGLPVVLVTAHDDKLARMAGLEAGADDFLTKPLDRLEVVVRLRAITALNRYRRMQAAVNGLEWVFEQAAIGLLWVNEAGGITTANTVARDLLRLGPAEEGAPSFLDAVSSRFSLEPAALWEGWPRSAADGVPRLLVHAGDDLRPFQVIEVAATGNPAVSKVLVRVEDVTSAYRHRAATQSVIQAVECRLREPLAALQAELLLLAGDGVAGGRLQRALDSVDRLAGTVEQVTAYGEVLSGDGGERVSVLGLPTVVEQTAQRVGVNVVLPSVPRAIRRGFLPWSRRQTETVLDAVFRASQQSYAATLTPLQVRANGSSQPAEITLEVICPLPERVETAWVSRGTLPGFGTELSVPALLAWQAGGRIEHTPRRDGWTQLTFVLPVVDACR